MVAILLVEVIPQGHIEPSKIDAVVLLPPNHLRDEAGEIVPSRQRLARLPDQALVERPGTDPDVGWIARPSYGVGSTAADRKGVAVYAIPLLTEPQPIRVTLRGDVVPGLKRPSPWRGRGKNSGRAHRYVVGEAGVYAPADPP